MTGFETEIQNEPQSTESQVSFPDEATNQVIVTTALE